MAVLAESISVIVSIRTLEERFPGGLDAYIKQIPNRTFCADGKLTRVGFMTPDDVRAYGKNLERLGLHSVEDDKWIDVAVVDQQRGLTKPCDWAETGRIPMGNGSVLAVRLKGDTNNVLMTPDGWKFEGSISQTYTFTPNEHVGKALKFLREEDGLEYYESRLTGKEVVLGRAMGRPRSRG